MLHRYHQSTCFPDEIQATYIPYCTHTRRVLLCRASLVVARKNAMKVKLDSCRISTRWCFFRFYLNGAQKLDWDRIRKMKYSSLYPVQERGSATIMSFTSQPSASLLRHSLAMSCNLTSHHLLTFIFRACLYYSRQNVWDMCGFIFTSVYSWNTVRSNE